jgi:hypothetical protein
MLASCRLLRCSLPKSPPSVYVRPALDREKNAARKKFGNAYTKTRLKKINWKKAYSSSSQSSQSQSSQSSSSSSLTNMYITLLKTNKRYHCQPISLVQKAVS